jgi:DNA-binding NarL/FixJ family response regulator
MMMARFVSRIEYPGTDGLPSAANLNHSRKGSLTDPEAHILLLLNAGKEKTQIAAEVGADEAAVKDHIKAILRKAIGVSSQRHDPTRVVCLVPGASRPVVEQ